MMQLQPLHGVPARFSPGRRIAGDLVVWTCAALSVGAWFGVTATVLEGLRDSSINIATLGRDLTDALGASVLTALLPGGLIGVVFAPLYAPAGLVAFGIWQAVREATSATARVWFMAATIGCFSSPPLFGALVLNAFSSLDGWDWWIAITGLGVSAAVAAAMTFLRPSLGARRSVDAS